MRYGTLDEHGRPVYFTGTIYVDGKPVSNPSRGMYLARGQKPFIETKPPAAKSGTHYVRAGWTEQQAAIVPKWRLVANLPPRARRWTRLAIKTALAQAGMLAAARQFLSATEIAQGYTAWEALTDCDYIEEGYGGAEAWNALLGGAAQALGKTRAEIDAFLDQIPAE